MIKMTVNRNQKSARTGPLQLITQRQCMTRRETMRKVYLSLLRERAWKELRIIQQLFQPLHGIKDLDQPSFTPAPAI
jgi:hypothetical protein